MEYKYEKERGNYEDFASGRVLLNAPGTTAFPVRLASELYLRARERLLGKGAPERLTVYDPCCGGAHLLATIGILHGSGLKRLIGSDVDPNAVRLAQRNLDMVNENGLAERVEQLREMHRQFGKASHAEAAESGLRLKEMVERRGFAIETSTFQADATGDGNALAGHALSAAGSGIDLVITDLPYGAVTGWSSRSDDPVGALLDNLLPLLAPHAVVVVVADKKQAVRSDRYRRLEKQPIGKRQFVVLEPLA